MFQRFNENTMLTKFIKNLIATTYVPMVKIWHKGDFVSKNSTYIAGQYIVRAIASGVDAKDATDSDYFDILEPYVKGKFYRGITSNYVSNTSIYDANTHYYLGQYLRMIRDLDDINLMQYYNCWDGTYSDNIRIMGDSTVIQDNDKKDGLKVLIVPIKFGAEYTLYLNNNMPTEICAIYYDGINILSNMTLVNSTYRNVNRISKNSPLLISSVELADAGIDSEDVLREEYLHLLIQLPESNSSSIVILEGNYLDNKVLMNNKLPKVYYGNEVPVDAWTAADLDNYCKSGIGLVNSVTEQNYAFSNRLIEYLLLNVIDKTESISDNIKRMQKYASTYKCEELNGFKLNNYNQLPGIWNNDLRKFSFDLVTNYQVATTFDVNGYIDKDTEAIILRGKN